MELLVTDILQQKILSDLIDYKSWDLTDRQICDLELLLNGGFYPLNGFLNQNEYESVCNNMRLKSGELWPMPITLDVNEVFANTVTVGDKIVLRDIEGVPLAVLEIESKFQPDKTKEANLVFGTTDLKHPAVDYLFNTAGNWYLGGKLLGLQLPTYYDYVEHRHTPKELKALFAKLGWEVHSKMKCEFQ